MGYNEIMQSIPIVDSASVIDLVDDGQIITFKNKYSNGINSTLNKTASFIFRQIINKETTIDALSEMMCKEYNIERTQSEKDILLLLNNLWSRGLIKWKSSNPFTQMINVNCTEVMLLGPDLVNEIILYLRKAQYIRPGITLKHYNKNTIKYCLINKIIEAYSTDTNTIVIEIGIEFINVLSLCGDISSTEPVFNAINKMHPNHPIIIQFQKSVEMEPYFKYAGVLKNEVCDIDLYTYYYSKLT